MATLLVVDHILDRLFCQRRLIALGTQTLPFIEYWLLGTSDDSQPGIDGALMRRQPNWPGVVNTIDVVSLEETVAAVAANGGKVVVPRVPVAGVGYLAYCADSEGNIFGVMQNDPSAHD